MADAVQDTIAASNAGYNQTANAGKAVGEGISAGASWASQKAQVDIAQAHLKIQQEQHEQMAKSWRAETMEKLASKYFSISKQAKGPVRDANIEAFDQINKASGNIFSPTGTAAATDEAYQGQLAQMQNAMDAAKVANPELYKDWLASAYQQKGIDGSSERFDQIIKQLNTMEQLGIKAKTAAALKQTTDDNRFVRQDRTIHNQVLARLSTDTGLRQRITQAQNLDNALALVTETDFKTPQQFNEAQQAIRANLGIKGQTGLNERERDYFSNLGFSSQAAEQILFGNVTSIDPENPQFKHVLQIGRIERGKVAKQLQTRFDELTAGHESIYERNPDLKADLENRKAAFLKEVAPPESSKLPSKEVGPLSASETTQLQKIADRINQYPAGPTRTAAVKKALDGIKQRGDKYVNPFMALVQQTTIGTK